MPIDMQIIEAGRIIHITFQSPWTADQMKPFFLEDKRYRDTVQRDYPTRKIHLLTTFPNTPSLPQGMMRARVSPSLTHPTSGQVAVVGSVALIRALGDAIFRVARFDKARFFDTNDQALAYLRQLILTEQPQ